MTHTLPKYVSQNVVVHRKSDTFPAQVFVPFEFSIFRMLFFGA